MSDRYCCLLASKQTYVQLKTVHTATGIRQTVTAVCLIASRQQFDIYLLLYVQSGTPDGGRKDLRNM
jgi:hypothetical protein